MADLVQLLAVAGEPITAPQAQTCHHLRRLRDLLKDLELAFPARSSPGLSLN